MSDGRRWAYAEALPVAERLVELLKPACEVVTIAGSLRRKKADVGDIELVYVPRTYVLDLPDLLGGPIKMKNEANILLAQLIGAKVLAPRLNKNGRPAWGERNKLAVDVATGIPVDLFETTGDAWSNYLVCRTGPAESNIRIAARAKAKGWRWNPYRAGFTRLADGHVVAMRCEREVFEFVGMPFLSPEERGKR